MVCVWIICKLYVKLNYVLITSSIFKYFCYFEKWLLENIIWRPIECLKFIVEQTLLLEKFNILDEDIIIVNNRNRNLQEGFYP